jgi:hypothetical protein
MRDSRREGAEIICDGRRAASGMGNERSAERHLLPFGLPLGQEARGLHLPQWETA